MGSDTTRLRRFIADETGECCDGDVDARLADLDTLSDEVPTDYETDLTALKSLGSETRYRIVRMLAAAERELCVCEITPQLDVSDSAVSHALSDLTSAELVTRRKEGTWRYYRSTPRAEQLIEALDSTRNTLDDERDPTTEQTR